MLLYHNGYMKSVSAKHTIKKIVREIADISDSVIRNVIESFRFLLLPIPGVSVPAKLGIIFRFVWISSKVECSHYLYEMLRIAEGFLLTPSTTPGVFVEAGAFKGGSTAKLSIIARIAKRKLIVCDSFEGLPPSKDVYTSRDGLFFRNRRSFTQTQTFYSFKKGQFAGSFHEVKKNIAAYGAPEVCEYRKGWFENTLPRFDEPIAGIFLDVDLSSSTKTCLRYLYPLLSTGGILFSHDGHLDLVVDVYKDKAFWKSEVGVKQPVILGLNHSRLLQIRKK